MHKEHLASALVRRLEQENVLKERLIGRSDEDIIIESALETLKDINGVVVSKDSARRALAEIKQERYEASLPRRIKRHYNKVMPSIKRFGRRALAVGSVAAVVSGISYGIGRGLPSALSNPDPSDFVAGKVIKVHGNSRGDYTLKVDTPKGIYEVDFYRHQSQLGREKREKLVQLIKEGVLVNFPTKNLPSERFGQERGEFYGKFGVIHTGDIAVTY